MKKYSIFGFVFLPRCKGLSRVLHISGVSPFKPG
jgi:hypothetical protein